MSSIRYTISFFKAITRPDFFDKMWEKWLKSEHPDDSIISEELSNRPSESEQYSYYQDVISDSDGTWIINYSDPGGKDSWSSKYFFKTFIEDYFSIKLKELKAQIDDILFLNRNLGLVDAKFKEYTNQLKPTLDEAKKIKWISAYPCVLTGLNDAITILKKARISFKGGQRSNFQAKKIECTLSARDFAVAVGNMVDKLQSSGFLKKGVDDASLLNGFLKGLPANPSKKICWSGDITELHYFSRLLSLREPGRKRPYVKWEFITEYFNKDRRPIIPKQLQYTKDPKDQKRIKSLHTIVSFLD